MGWTAPVWPPCGIFIWNEVLYNESHPPSGGFRYTKMPRGRAPGQNILPDGREKQGKGSAQADAHGAGYVEHLAVVGHAAGLAGNVRQRVGRHVAVHHGNGHAVVLVGHQAGGIGAELGGQYAI